MLKRRNTLHAKPLHKHAFDWRQMATNGKIRIRTIKNIWLIPFFKKRTQPTHTTPLLIVGRNGWLNLMWAWKLSPTHPEIWIWNVEGNDWWNYKMIVTPMFLNVLKMRLPFLANGNIEKTAFKMIQQIKSQSKIVMIEGGHHPFETHQDEHTGGWVLKIKKGVWPVMEGKLAHDKERTDINKRITKLWEPHETVARWPRKTTNPSDLENEGYYLLAKKVFWTSLPPQGVMPAASHEKNYLVFHSPLEREAVGSARRIAQTAETFFNQPVEDTNWVFDFKETSKPKETQKEELC